MLDIALAEWVHGLDDLAAEAGRDPSGPTQTAVALGDNPLAMIHMVETAATNSVVGLNGGNEGAGNSVGFGASFGSIEADNSRNVSDLKQAGAPGRVRAVIAGCELIHLRWVLANVLREMAPINAAVETLCDSFKIKKPAKGSRTIRDPKAKARTEKSAVGADSIGDNGLQVEWRLGDSEVRCQ